VFAADAPPHAMTCAKSSSSAASARCLACGWFRVHHDVGVDVAVAGMAETGDGQIVLFLQARGELEQIGQLAARHDDIFIKLGQAGVAEGVGKFAPDFPDGFALGGAQATFNKQRLLPADDFFQVLNLAPDGFSPGIQLDNQMGAAIPKAFAPGAFVGGGEGDSSAIPVRRAKTGGQDGLQRAHGIFHGTESDGQAGPDGGKRNQLSVASVITPSRRSEPTKRRCRSKPVLFFVRPTAEPDKNHAVGEDDFQAEDVVAGDAVFEAVRPPALVAIVAADEIVRAAGGVGRKKTVRVSRRPPANFSVLTPGSTTATKSPALISRMRFMRSMTGRCRRARARSRRRSRGPRPAR